MKQIVNYSFMALVISFVFVACNNEEKTEPASTDTTGTETTMTENTSQNQDMDAAIVASGLYKVVKDTMGIRVLEINYKPGDSSAMHSHPDLVLYVVNSGKTEFTEEDGSKRTMDLPAGTPMIVGATTHSVKNVGTTTVKGYLFEVNRPNKTATTEPDALDATKVASRFYKPVKDSLNIRTVMVEYKPGGESALHSHPDLAMYVITPAKAEFTAKDGTKQVMTMAKGTIVVLPADTHSVKNVGSTNAKVLLVEVNRPRQ